MWYRKVIKIYDIPISKADTDSPHATIGKGSGSLMNSGNDGQSYSNKRQYFAAFAGLCIIKPIIQRILIWIKIYSL